MGHMSLVWLSTEIKGPKWLTRQLQRANLKYLAWNRTSGMSCIFPPKGGKINRLFEGVDFLKEKNLGGKLVLQLFVWQVRTDALLPPSPHNTFQARMRWVDVDVSENSGFPPKSSILIGFSIINHPFWGTPIFGNTHVVWGWSCCLLEWICLHEQRGLGMPIHP